MEKLKIEQMVITPEMAKDMLRFNINNRKPNQSRINEYALAMTNEKFEISTDAIGFDTNGILINGQHRLMACVKSGYPFEAIVVRGFKPKTFEVIDQGKARTGYDVAKNDEAYIKNTTSLAATSFILCKVLKQYPENEFGNIIKVEYTKKYRGIARFTHDIKHMGGYLASSAPTTVAMIAAIANGVPISKIKDFVLAGRNEIKSTGYNNKAALDYIDYKRNGSGGKKQIYYYEACKEAIYLFVNNVRKTQKTNIYPLTEESIEAVNGLFVKMYEIGEDGE